MSLVPSAAMQNVEIKFNRGIDGNNNEAQTKQGFVLEAVNVDLSVAQQAQKRGGYSKWGGRFPAKLGAARPKPGGTNEYFVELATTFVATVASTTLSLEKKPSDYDSSYFAGDMRDTCLVRMVGNKIPITDKTLFAPVNSTLGRKFSPLLILSDEVVVLPKALFKAISVGTTPVTVDLEIYEGLTLPRISTEIELVEVTGGGLLSVTFADSSHGLRTQSQVIFEAGPILNSTLVQEYLNGQVLQITNNTVFFQVSLGDTSVTIDSVASSFLKIRYGVNPFVNIAKGGNFFRHNLAQVSKCVTTNQFSFVQEVASIPTFNFANATNPTWFVYGLPIQVGEITLLNNLNSTKENKLVAGYGGYLFAESLVATNSSTALKIKQFDVLTTSQSLVATNGQFSIEYFDSQIVFPGDEVFWDLPEDAPEEQLQRRSFVVVGYTSSSVIVDSAGLQTLTIPANTNIKYRRFAATNMQLDSTTSTAQDNFRNLCWESRSFKMNNLFNNTPVLAIEGIVQQRIYFDTAIDYNSDDVFVGVPFWKVVSQPDNADISLLAIEDRNKTTDLVSEVFDFSLYTTTINNGVFRYNGVQSISSKLPAPPTPLIRNIPGSGGTLEVVQGDNNTLVGRKYNFIVTYSYFETVNGVSRKIESGITPETDVSIVAQPALDGSVSSQKVEIQVASIPRGVGLPADSIFVNVYRTLNGIDESGVDTGQYLLERSTLNNPDNLFTSIIVGDVPSFDFNNANADRLYTTIQSQNIGSLPNNAPAPNSSYLVNFSNRLLAANCGKDPYIEFTCQKVFDTVTRDFKAFSKLEALVSTDLAKPYASFVTCPIGAATTSGSGADFTGLVDTNINYNVLSLPSLSVSAVVYDDQSHILTVNKTTATTQNILSLRFMDKSGTASTQYNIDFEGQTFKRVSATGSDTLFRSLTQKTKQAAQGYNTRPMIAFAADEVKVGDVIAVPSPTNGLFVRKSGLVKQDDVNTLTLAAQPIYLERDNTNSTTIAANEFFVVQGLGTSVQILDKENGRALNLDREIVFQRVNAAVNQMQVKLFVIEGGKFTYLESFYLNKIITNNTGENINSQFTILRLTSTTTGSGKSYTPTSNTVTNTTTPPTTATITAAVAHGVAAVTDNSYVALSDIGQIPSNNGVNYSGMFKILSVVSTTQLTIQVVPSDKVFRSSLEGGSEGSKTSLTGKAVFPETSIVPSATDLQISVPLFTNSSSRNFYSGSYCFIIATGGDEQSHSFQLSGYFKIKEFRQGATVRQIVTNGQAFDKIVLDTNGSQTLSVAELSSLEQTKIVLMTQVGYSLDSTNQKLLFPEYIPVPVPLTVIDDLTSSMFATKISDTTPLSKVIKRFALAINSTISKIGFAYWGSAVTSNSEPFPANGFRFVARQNYFKPEMQAESLTIPTAFRMTSKQDKQIPGQQKSLYTLTGATTANNSTDNYTTGLVQYVREFDPNRIYWTDAANVELSRTAPSFKDNSFFKDLPSTDGEVISALHVFQNFLLIFKPSGIYRAQFNGNDLILERVQSPVGSIAYKNIVSNEQFCYFVHFSGVYKTNGYEVTPILELKELFREFVAPNPTLLRDTCGTNDNISKLVCLGVPYDKTTLLQKTDNQFVLNYFDDVQAWSRNTQFDARWWSKRDSKRYFSGNKGFVYAIRYETGVSKFQDDTSSIPFRLKTLFLGTSNEVVYKFYREVVLQYGPFKDAKIKLSLCVDYNNNERLLEEIKIPGVGFGYQPWGTSAFGGDGQFNHVRRTTIPNRAKQVSFVLENNEVEQNILIAGVFVAAEMGSNTMTKQNAT